MHLFTEEDKREKSKKKKKKHTLNYMPIWLIKQYWKRKTSVRTAAVPPLSGR